jgi:hypothetical protein
LLANVRSAASRLGFRTNDDKTRILSVEEYLKTNVRDLSLEQLDDDAYARAIGSKDIRLVRYLLPRMGTRGDPTALSSLASVVDDFPALLPRASQYVDAVSEEPKAAAVFNQLATQSSAWRQARLLPVLRRNPFLSGEASELMLQAASGSKLHAIRALAWSNLQCAPESLGLSGRLVSWNQARDRIDAVPVVETWL